MKKRSISIIASLVICFSSAVLTACKKTENTPKATVYDELADTYCDYSVKTGNPPAVITDVTDKSALESVPKDGERPSNVILRFKSGKILDKNGNEIADFGQFFTDTLKGRIIPVFYLADDRAADDLLDFYDKKLYVTDASVMSSDPAIVKKVRQKLPSLRGMICFKDGLDAYEIVKTLSLNEATVAVLSQSDATSEKVAYIQARFKTVWTVAESSDKISLYDCVGSGTYGVITDDFGAAYDVIESYDKYGLTRANFCVAHRGLPDDYNENSVSGISAALKAGATHVETDGYLTTDNEIVLMHDSTIDRTTDGSGEIESMSLAELRRYKLDLHGSEEIPVFEDIVPLFANTDAVLVFELKTSNVKLVDELKKRLDKLDFYKNIVIVAFSESGHKRVREVLPEVPAAYLSNDCTIDGLPEILKTAGKYNAAIDVAYSQLAPDHNKMLAARGLVGWYWTYEDASSTIIAQREGYAGITSNAADICKDFIRFVTGIKNSPATLAVGDEIELECTDYCGNKVTAAGTVFFLTDNGDEYEVIAVVKNAVHPTMSRFYTLLYTEKLTFKKTA